MPMWPSEVRDEILAEHGKVIELLDDVEEEVQRVLNGATDVARLRDRAFALESAIAALIETEESILEPTLKDTDSWGEVRAEQVERVHERQRRALAESREAFEAGKMHPGLLAEIVGDAVAEVRADLAKVQRRALGPELLRDDLVVSGQTAG